MMNKISLFIFGISIYVNGLCFEIDLSRSSPGNTMPTRNQGRAEWCTEFSATQATQECLKNNYLQNLPADCSDADINSLLAKTKLSPWYRWGVARSKDLEEGIPYLSSHSITSDNRSEGCFCSDEVVNRAFKSYMILYLAEIKNIMEQKGVTELVSSQNSLVISKEDIDKLVLSTENMRSYFNENDLFSMFSPIKRNVKNKYTHSYNICKDKVIGQHVSSEYISESYMGECRELSDDDKRFCSIFKTIKVAASRLNGKFEDISISSFDPKVEIQNACKRSGLICSCSSENSTANFSNSVGESCGSSVQTCIPQKCQNVKAMYGNLAGLPDNVRSQLLTALESNDTFRKVFLKERVKKIEEKLKEGSPLMISYCVGALTGHYCKNTDLNGNNINHASAVTGVRSFTIGKNGEKIEGKPQVLIKNSWGASCSGYKDQITSRTCYSESSCLHPECNGVESTICQGACYKGQMWVDAESVLLGRRRDDSYEIEVAELYGF